jgi:2,3-bisphosphoglycerate-dependent phosphoglycerate mutase
MKSELPDTESLKICLGRVLPYWKKVIVPEIKKKKRILIVAHGNSLRALIKHLDGISDEAISELNIPTGIPLVYELNNKLKPIRHYYLGDEKAAAEAAAKVAAQAKK